MQYDDIGYEYNIKIKEGAEEKIKIFLVERGYEIESVDINDYGAWAHEGDNGLITVSNGTLELHFKNGNISRTTATNFGGFLLVNYSYAKDEEGETEFSFSDYTFNVSDLEIQEKDLEDFEKLLAEVVDIK